MFVMLLFASGYPDQPLQTQKFINPLLMKRNDCIQLDLCRRDETTDTTVARISSQMIDFTDCISRWADSYDSEKESPLELRRCLSQIA